MLNLISTHPSDGFHDLACDCQNVYSSRSNSMTGRILPLLLLRTEQLAYDPVVYLFNILNNKVFA